MAKTPAEDIKKRLLTANDTSYYEGLWKQVNAAFGEQWGSVTTGVPTAGHTFKDYPDITPRFKEVGVSTRIINAQILMLTQMMREAPEPDFPQVDKRTGEVRKQFWLERARGTGYADGSWMDELVKAWLDGHGLGNGFVQVGIKENPKTGYQRVHVKHIPIFQMLWDRHERSFARARWACPMHYLPVDVAEEMFGAKAVKDHIVTLDEARSDERLEVVRCFEYHDIGRGLKGEPTRAVILGDITNDPIDVDENPWECLPFPHYEHLLLPNQRRASGVIPLLMPHQEGLNQMERKFRANSKRRGFDIANQEVLNTEDLDRVNAGEDGVIVRYEDTNPLDKANPPFVRVPGGEVAQSDLAYMEMLEAEFRANAGLSELDRGSDVSDADTLGEVKLVDQRSRKQASWTVSQTARFFVRVVEKVMKVAEIGDTDPVVLDINGVNVPFNLPEEPASAIALWLSEPSSVVIGEETLLREDKQAESLQRQQQVLSYLQVGADPLWVAQEFIKAGGDDPKEVLPQMTQQMGGQELPGQAGPNGPTDQGGKSKGKGPAKPGAGPQPLQRPAPAA